MFRRLLSHPPTHPPARLRDLVGEGGIVNGCAWSSAICHFDDSDATYGSVSMYVRARANGGGVAVAADVGPRTGR